MTLRKLYNDYTDFERSNDEPTPDPAGSVKPEPSRRTVAVAKSYASAAQHETFEGGLGI